MNRSCDREWTRQFIANSFTGTFINGKLKTHREQVLFDIERALLPATQPIVERHIVTENVTNQMRQIREQIYNLNREKHRLNAELYRVSNREAPVERTEFVKACPNTDCRGFLSSQWKCGICQLWACPDCHEIKGDTRDAAHTCNPETVATVSLLANDTRPCPKCRTGIYRISGCDQMWCTQCHTAFNWRSGRIENNVHNPHYFEWLRRNGNAVPRTPGDVPCQQNELRHNTYMTIRDILRARHGTHPFAKTCDDFLAKVIRNTLHVRYAVMGTYRVGDRAIRNESLRIQYMRNRITQDQFKTQLQRNEKKNAKYTEIHNALDILVNTMTDIIFRFHHHVSSCAENGFEMAVLEEIDPIVDYVNECLRETSRTYGSKLIRFSNEIVLK
jgi:hypothetical protein